MYRLDQNNVHARVLMPVVCQEDVHILDIIPMNKIKRERRISDLLRVRWNKEIRHFYSTPTTLRSSRKWVSKRLVAGEERSREITTFYVRLED